MGKYFNRNVQTFCARVNIYRTNVNHHFKPVTNTYKKHNSEVDLAPLLPW